MSQIHIGTSGWVYKSWDKAFYPEDVASGDQLQFYATQFSTVEINATFYRLPTLKMVHGWRKKAPPGFVFAVKGSRYITHMKKLVNLGGGLNKFVRRVQPLGPRLGRERMFFNVHGAVEAYLARQASRTGPPPAANPA